MPDIHMGALIGGAIGGAMAGLLHQCNIERRCPDCQAILPKLGLKNMRSVLWGGWICPACRCQIDRKGRKVTKAVG
jgi:hypothetical protein